MGASILMLCEELKSVSFVNLKDRIPGIGGDIATCHGEYPSVTELHVATNTTPAATSGRTTNIVNSACIQ
jgi:hypothetical protein